MVVIDMSPTDITMAVNEGTSRYIFNRMRRNSNRGAAPTWVEQVSREVSGCLGEIAIARWLDKFPFSLFEDRKLGDVGAFEVRTTAYETGRLLITKDDDPMAKFLLVTLPKWDCAHSVGWLHGYEAQQDQYWDSHMRIPTYAVPQSELRQPETLLG
jgi:hypothetical protein